MAMESQGLLERKLAWVESQNGEIGELAGTCNHA